MPHLIVDYAQDLANAKQAEAMLEAIHAAVVASGLFAEAHIKTHLVPIALYRVGVGRNPHIHAQLRIIQVSAFISAMSAVITSAAK